MTVERVGTGYQLAAGDVLLSVTRLRESRGELTGELRALVAGIHLTISRLNLSSAVARRTMSQVLRGRANGRGADVDWTELLEQLSVGVLAAEHAPAPLVEVGHRPPRAAPPRLLDPLLPAAAPTLIFGPGGAGKSTLAAAIAVSVASGLEVVKGWRPPRPTPVAVLDYEATEDELNDRVAALSAGANMEPPSGIFYCPARRPLADQVEDLAGVLDEHHVGLLIVDSVGLASGTTREGSDAAESALRLFTALRTLGRTSLLIDHVRGDDLTSDRAGTRPYGSVYKMNLSRAVYELRREEAPGADGAQLALLHRKLNDGPLLPATGLRVVHGPSTIRVERCEVTAPDLEHGALPVAERMRRELRTGPLPAKVLAERLGVPAESIRTALHRDKQLQRLADGRLCLAVL